MAIVAAAAISLMAVGCASIERLPAVPYAQARETKNLDIPDARFYLSEANRNEGIALEAYRRRNKVRTAFCPYRKPKTASEGQRIG